MSNERRFYALKTASDRLQQVQKKQIYGSRNNHQEMPDDKTPQLNHIIHNLKNPIHLIDFMILNFISIHEAQNHT